MVWLYLGFLALIFALLALDLGVFHRKLHVVKTKEALAWTAVWVSIGVAFSGVIYLGYEQHWMGWAWPRTPCPPPRWARTARSSTTTATAPSSST